MEKVLNELDRAVILGRAGVGMTSFLFSLAYTAAEQDSASKVLFICNKASVEHRFPSRVRFGFEGGENQENNNQNLHLLSDDWAPTVLGRISMKYVESSGDLRRLMAGIHAFRPVPQAIFIDDFDGLFGYSTDPQRYSREGGSNENISLTCALVEDGLDSLNTGSQSCRLYIGSRTTAATVSQAIGRVCRFTLILRGYDDTDVGAVSKNFVVPNPASARTPARNTASSEGKGLYFANGTRFI
jgi:hypothetical protein